MAGPTGILEKTTLVRKNVPAKPDWRSSDTKADVLASIVLNFKLRSRRLLLKAETQAEGRSGQGESPPYAIDFILAGHRVYVSNFFGRCSRAYTNFEPGNSSSDQ